MKLFAMTAPGVEGILASELKRIGVRVGAGVSGGVSFTGDNSDLQRVNLWSRVANRVVVRVDEFHASSFYELERRAKKVEWARYLPVGTGVRFRVTCRKSRLYHSDAVTQRLAAAVEYAVGAKLVSTATNEDDDTAPAGQLFIVRMANDVCTISADSSGELLHRRGYRQAIAKAPLRETLAAAMLIGSDWNPSTSLVDPMCGSGTIPIEAAMIARQIAPGRDRAFAFESWPDHDSGAWRQIVDEARAQELENAQAPIIASDRDAGAVTATRENALRAGVAGDIRISERAISDAEYPSEQPGFIVTNPPYGLRVGESEPLRNLYSQLGNILRGRARGYLLALLSADRALESQLRLDLTEVFRTTNGGIPVRLLLAQGRRQ